MNEKLKTIMSREESLRLVEKLLSDIPDKKTRRKVIAKGVASVVLFLLGIAGIVAVFSAISASNIKVEDFSKVQKLGIGILSVFSGIGVVGSGFSGNSYIKHHLRTRKQISYLEYYKKELESGRMDHIESTEKEFRDRLYSKKQKRKKLKETV